MKVTLINTSDAGGGAPAACLRLLKALEGQGIDANLLVQKKTTRGRDVTSVERNLFDRKHAMFNFLYERLSFIALHEKDKSVRFAFSTANAGMSIKNEKLIKDADILHLHWTNSGFLSIRNLRELLMLGKPIVWTMHDMWAFTGGCHYAGDCGHFSRQCGDCFFLKDPGKADISYTGWLRKADMYSGVKNISFVACSEWLADIARQSSLLKGYNIQSIPNPIDTHIFSPGNKAEIRAKRKIDPDKKVILFGAANINDRRKGISYLVEALRLLKNDYPVKGQVEIVVFGKNRDFDLNALSFPVHELNIITSQEEMAEIYSMADVFVTPSIEDNLPNTVMEAMACGTPVVAFNTGGIPEMIDHQQNGYLANFKASGDMAKGLYEMLYASNYAELSQSARSKVLRDFNNETVASQYIELYQSLLKK
ncbi:MAG: glycosyltransferase family 4 protein [Mucilaginibacter sp.]